LPVEPPEAGPRGRGARSPEGVPEYTLQRSLEASRGSSQHSLGCGSGASGVLLDAEINQTRAGGEHDEENQQRGQGPEAPCGYSHAA
jgi:hypothetical protein